MKRGGCIQPVSPWHRDSRRGSCDVASEDTLRFWGSRVCPNNLGNEMLRPSWTRPLVEELEEFTIMPYRMSNVSGGGGNNSSLRSLITVQSKDLFLQKWSCHQSPRKNKCRKQTFLAEQVHREYIYIYIFMHINICYIKSSTCHM